MKTITIDLMKNIMRKVNLSSILAYVGVIMVGASMSLIGVFVRSEIGVFLGILFAITAFFGLLHMLLRMSFEIWLESYYEKLDRE